MRPRSTIATASQVRSTSSRRCEESTTVRPSSTKLSIIARISCMPAGSSPFMGSSKMSSSGSPSKQDGDAKALAHAQRVGGDLPVGALGQAHLRKRRRDPRLGLASPCRRQKEQVLATGQVGVKARLIDDRADAGEGPAALGWDGHPEQRHRAAVGSREPEQGANQGGLAGAVRSQVTERAAARHEQLDVVESDGCAEALGKAVGLHCPAAWGRGERSPRDGAGRPDCASSGDRSLVDAVPCRSEAPVRRRSRAMSHSRPCVAWWRRSGRPARRGQGAQARWGNGRRRRPRPLSGTGGCRTSGCLASLAGARSCAVFSLACRPCQPSCLGGRALSSCSRMTLRAIPENYDEAVAPPDVPRVFAPA